MAAESTVTKTFRNGNLNLSDGTGVPLSYDGSYEDGDFAADLEKAARTVVYDRGVIVGLRKGLDPVQSFTITVDMRQFTNAAQATIVDVIEQTGAWAGAISVASTNYEFFLVKAVFTVSGTAFGDTADHVMTMNNVLLTWSFKEGDRNKIVIKGEVYGAITRSGPA